MHYTFWIILASENDKKKEQKNKKNKKKKTKTLQIQTKTTIMEFNGTNLVLRKV